MEKVLFTIGNLEVAVGKKLPYGQLTVGQAEAINRLGVAVVCDGDNKVVTFCVEGN